jgi:hypothetical protein
MFNISNLEVRKKYISVFASGHSIETLTITDLKKLYEDTYMIWLNYAPIKYNDYIDVLIFSDPRVSEWLQSFYQRKNDIGMPMLWTREKAFKHNSPFWLKERVNFWYDFNKIYKQYKTNYTFICALLELQRFFKDKTILIFGLDLDGRDKWYSKYIKVDEVISEDENKQRVDDTAKHLDLYITKNNVYNCNLRSCYKGFKKKYYRSLLR